MAASNSSANSTAVEECPICLTRLDRPDRDIFTTSCKHHFHFQCLVQNVQAKNNVCPLCRTQLNFLVDTLNKMQSNIPDPSTINRRPLVRFNTQHQTSVSAASYAGAAWTAFTRPFSAAFGYLSKSFQRPASASVVSARSERDGASREDLIDAGAVRALAKRIRAARQARLGNTLDLPMIAVTTTLEFGARESTRQSNIYGMVSLKAPSLFSTDTSEAELDELHVPVDLICIVDQSGSMAGEKMALLKQTLNHIIDQLKALDRLAILSFNTETFDRTYGLKLMTDDRKEIIQEAIRDLLHASGGTYIGGGLQSAIHIMKNRRTPNPLGALLLLTDGQDNRKQDYSRVMRSLPEGVVCHTFGYGNGHNAALLSSLAEQGNGGTFTYIDKTDAVGPAFATALGGLFTCMAKQLRVDIELEQGYEITRVHTSYEYEPKRLPTRQLTLRMTDLNADESRNLVFQLTAPKIKSGKEEHTIGHARLEYIDTSAEQVVRTPSVPFLLARPSQIDPHSPLMQVNRTLDVQRNRAETTEVLKQAVEADNYALARELITAQLQRIRSSVSAQDPLCQQLIRDLEYQYSNQHEFRTNMTNMLMQHGQERGTYSTSATASAACYKTASQERYGKKFTK